MNLFTDTRKALSMQCYTYVGVGQIKSIGVEYIVQIAQYENIGRINCFRVSDRVAVVCRNEKLYSQNSDNELYQHSTVGLIRSSCLPIETSQCALSLGLYFIVNDTM